MATITLDINNDPNAGLYAFATDKYCLSGEIPQKDKRAMEKALGVPLYSTKFAGTNLAGIFAAGNSSGVILPDIMLKHEIEILKPHLEILVLKTKYTALGNLILSNDKGCVISPDLEKHKKDIADFLNVSVDVGRVSGLDLVGSLAAATNKGCAINKFATEKEREHIKSVLGVTVSPATINYGSTFVRSGVVANSSGSVLGVQTTGPEMQAITEVLGLI